MTSTFKKLALALAFSVGSISAIAAPQASAGNGAVTREQVRAAVLQARTTGELDLNETNTPWTPKAPPSHLTRAEVHAEAVRARKAGELDFNETNYPREQQAVPSMISRMQVHDDAVAARKHGDLDWNDATYPDAAEHGGF